MIPYFTTSCTTASKNCQDGKYQLCHFILFDAIMIPYFTTSCTSTSKNCQDGKYQLCTSIVMISIDITFTFMSRWDFVAFSLSIIARPLTTQDSGQIVWFW